MDIIIQTKKGPLEIPPGGHWLTTTRGMSGYFAVEMWHNPDMGGFAEPYDTGIGRYDNPDDAYEEAEFWAVTLNIPLQVKS